MRVLAVLVAALAVLACAPLAAAQVIIDMPPPAPRPEAPAKPEVPAAEEEADQPVVTPDVELGYVALARYAGYRARPTGLDRYRRGYGYPYGYHPYARYGYNPFAGYSTYFPVYYGPVISPWTFGWPGCGFGVFDFAFDTDFEWTIHRFD